ncbi:MAG: hypothetical protein KBC78_04425 [Candidatus Pacebacteria bacterium]|nr:hypothetical protein [Candidatus Paceibacterota bacterium]
MTFQKLIIALFLIPSFILSAVPLSVQAKTISSEQHRLELIAELQDLLSQLLVIQKQLEEKRGYSSLTNLLTKNRTPYESQFYNFSHRAIYFVDNNKLINSESRGGVGNVDQKLFDLFTAVVGEVEVNKYVDEWRVFDNKNADLGAYVELMPTTASGPRNWIVGVNMADYDYSVTKSFANLFVHEYGHILFYDKPDFMTSYKNNFWTTSDVKHSEKINKVDGEERLDLTQDYYEKNSQRFVSDYATVSVDEDMAETFVYFIREDKPLGNTIRDQKIRTFYQEPDLVGVRTKIRANLRVLGVM